MSEKVSPIYHQIHFEITAFDEVAPEVMIPTYKGYWKPIVGHFEAKSNRFRIECWREEEQAIQSAVRFAQEKDESFANMTILRGKLTPPFLEMLLANPYDDNGRIKWFSLILQNEEQPVLSSEHHGTEFYAPRVTKEEIAFIRSVLPGDAIVNVWDNEGQ